MKNNIDISSIFKAIAGAFKRYNLTIFIVVIVGGLATAVLMLNETIRQSSDITGYTSTLDNTNYDQATIDHIKQLHTSSDTTTSTELPEGRLNPFSE